MNDWKRYGGLTRLLGLIVGLPLLVGSFGIRRTLEMRRTVDEQAERIEQVRTASLAPPVAVADTTPDAWIRDGSFLRLVGVDRPDVIPERYTPWLIRQQGDAGLYAGELVLSGRFIPMTRLLAEIESALPERIVSVGYRLNEQQPGRQKKLQMTLIVQQITENQTP
jgi:hypothetical protein